MDTSDNAAAAGNRRRFTRFPFVGQVRLYSSGAMWETQLIDLSLRGALVRRPADFSGRQGFHYRLELRLHGNLMIAMGVVVAHLEPEHLGLRCERLDFESFVHLKRLVELNLGDVAMLNRELAALDG